MNGFANRSSTSCANASASGTSTLGTISSKHQRGGEGADALDAPRVAHRLAAGEQRDRRPVIVCAPLSRRTFRSRYGAMSGATMMPRVGAGEAEGARATRRRPRSRTARYGSHDREQARPVAERSRSAAACWRRVGAPGTMRSTSVLQNGTLLEPLRELAAQRSTARRARARCRGAGRRCPRSARTGGR